MINLLERSGVMKEMVENEMLMRREKREREYKKPEPTRAREEYYPQHEEPEEPRRKRDDRDR